MSISAIGNVPPPSPTLASSVGSNTSSKSGIVYSGNLATYNGQPIALSAIYDNSNGQFTTAQQAEANKVQSAAEYNAFGKYAGSDSQAGNKQFVVAYISYVQSLPSYEQNSQRYAGTLQSAQNLLNEINNTPNSSASSSSTSTSSTDGTNEPGVLRILRTLNKALKDEKSRKSSQSAPVDIIDLSPAAQSYLSTAHSAVPSTAKRSA
jgi:thiamine kinase-like enzyme